MKSIELLKDFCEDARNLPHWPFTSLQYAASIALPGNVGALAGMPGAGKTWFIMQIMSHMLIHENKRPAALMLEEQTCKYTARFMSQVAEDARFKSIAWVADNPDKLDEWSANNEELIKMFEDSLTCAEDTGTTFTVQMVLRWAERRMEAGYKFLIIDPITYIQSSEKKWEDDQNLVNGLKAIATRHKGYVLMVTHPTKAGMSKQNEKDMSMLAGGSTIQRACQFVIWLSGVERSRRDCKDLRNLKVTEHSVTHTIDIMKARDGSHPGREIGLRFLPTSLTYEEGGLIVKPEDQ